MTETLQQKIEFIFNVTYDGSGTQHLMVNEAIQELREEIGKLFTFQHTEYYEGNLVCTDTYVLLKDVIALIGEKHD